MPKGAPDYMILKRRQQEDARRVIESFTQDNFKAQANAEWEIKTAGFIDHTKTKQRFESIRAADRAALDARRQKLANFLGQEQALFQQQLEQMDESPAERRQRMESRATELKDKREQERMDFVQQQYERQWRMACDPLREQESKAILRATNAARAYQIGEKMKALELDEQESRAFDDLWEKDRQAKLGREEREEEARRHMDTQHKQVLDQQVSELHAYREQERQLAADESSLMREQWELEKAEAAKIQALRQQTLDTAQQELHEFNQHKRTQLEASVATEREEDMERLNYQLALERANEEAEAAMQESMQKETRLFAEAMMQQKRAAASREAEIEKARQAEQDKAWEKRLAVWGQEQEARERLMAQVLHERKVQVDQKVIAAEIEKEKAAEARYKLEAELGRVNAMEANKTEAGRQVRMEHRALLENQIKDKAFQRAAAQFNKAQEKMAAERAEAAYQAMLDSQMSKTKASMAKYAAQ